MSLPDKQFPFSSPTAYNYLIYSGFLIGLGVVAGAMASAAEPVLWKGQPAELQIQAATEHSVRIVLREVVQGHTSTIPPQNPAFLPKSWRSPVAAIRELDGPATVPVGTMTVRISSSPLTVTVMSGDGRVVQDLTLDQAHDGLSFSVGQAAILGLGEGAKNTLDLGGQAYPLINGQHKDRILGARIHVPWLIGTSGWALLVAAPSGEFDLTGPRGIFAPKNIQTERRPDLAAGALFDFLVFDASQPEVLMREQAELTGRAVMPPRWALGYMQSFRSLESTGQMLAIAKQFRERKLPCDAMIYLGTGFCPKGWNEDHDSLIYNSQLFKQPPEQTIADLHAQHLRVVLHVVPPGFSGGNDKRPLLHGTIPSEPGDILDAGHIASYWSRHLPAFSTGIDGWWPDEGDWFDVQERFARHRMYYEGPLSVRPDERPWNIQRNGYLGVARYGGWIWSGDVGSSWETLAAQVSVGLNFSVSVSPYWGTDTGGFIPTKDLTGELYARWFQFSAFCPSFRSHGRSWELRLPWGWNTGRPGIVEHPIVPDAKELHNAGVEPVCQRYLNLRYQLLSYNVNLAREAYDTGMPFMRALWLHYPHDLVAAKRGDEYLWGRDLLIAPVTSKGATVRRVYLPEGNWYDWWSGERLTGGREIERTVDPATMPILVREGAIIPFDPLRQFTDELVTEPTELRIYPGKDGFLALCEDDGRSLEYLRTTGAGTHMTWDDAGKILRISAAPNQAPRSPRQFTIRVMPNGPVTTVDFKGTPLKIRL